MASSRVTPRPAAHPFDAVAPDYDAAFTKRQLGRWLRSIVWQRLEQAFEPGQHVLDLGCGTGEDAVWLAQRGIRVTATDASAAMLDITRAKAEAAGVGDRVEVARLDLTGSLDLPAAYYDGVMSNFGPLNCVPNRRALADTLAASVRPGGRVVVVVMGPLCPWEMAWHLGHLQPRTAFRRLSAGRPARVGDGGTLPVWYPRPGRLQSEFAADFRVLETAGVGLLLPPSAMGGLVDRAPRLFARLARLDQRFATTLPWRWLNDHYLMVLERR